LRSHVEKRLCHGLFADTIPHGDAVYDIRSLRWDLHPGGEWHADPFYVRTVTIPTIGTVAIDGTFRHKECMLYDCTRCSSIHVSRDVREHVVAESRAVLKRGERVAMQGVRLEYLQQSELIETSRFWYAEYAALDLRAHLLSLKVAGLSVTKVKLSEKLEQALEQASLPDVAVLFKRAAETAEGRAFEERGPLLNFLTDTAKNHKPAHS
jgi:hypothetical protein